MVTKKLDGFIRKFFNILSPNRFRNNLPTRTVTVLLFNYLWRIFRQTKIHSPKNFTSIRIFFLYFKIIKKDSHLNKYGHILIFATFVSCYYIIEVFNTISAFTLRDVGNFCHKSLLDIGISF